MLRPSPCSGPKRANDDDDDDDIIKKYRHWKRRGESLVIATVEGEIEGKRKRGRRRIDWAENISQWEGGMDSARRRAWRKTMAQ